MSLAMRVPRSLWTRWSCEAFGALLVGSLAGCDRASASTSACSFEGTVAQPDASAPLDTSSLEANAEAQGLAFLDGVLAPYVRGEVPLYQGTLTAHDNQGVLGAPPTNGSPGYMNQSIPEGPAVAALSVVGKTATLTVHSLSQHKYMVLEQDESQPGVTSIGIILSDTVGGGNSGTCSGCVPAFRDKPATIDFAGANATSAVNLDVFGDADNVTLHTYAAANLELTPPCSITFEEVAELSADTGVTFVPTGSEWVGELSGVAVRDTLGVSYCDVPFTIELYVSASNLAAYGVRNLELTENACPP
jgi:hypothetical protein